MDLRRCNKLALPTRLTPRALRAIYDEAIEECRRRLLCMLTLTILSSAPLLALNFYDAGFWWMREVHRLLPLGLTLTLAGTLIIAGLRLSYRIQEIRELREEMQAQLEHARRSVWIETR